MERAVQKIRLECQKISSNEEAMENTLEISPILATKLIQNMNMLQFVRKSILSTSNALFKAGIPEISEKFKELAEDNLAFFSKEYEPEIHDL